MKSVSLGTAGLKVSKIGFGCMGITAFYGTPIPDSDAMALLKSVYDSGCTHFDTAEIYRTGNPFAPPTEETQYNEAILGKFINTVERESVTVATKFHPGVPTHNGGVDLKTVEAAVDASLARLGLTYIDLYYCHRMPKTLALLEEYMTSVKALVQKGKIKYVGLSEVGPVWLRAAHAIHPVTCVQQEWSLVTRNLEEHLVPVCAELGVGIVAYSPLARNLLAVVDAKAPPADWRATNPRYSAENFAQNQMLARQIKALGTAKQLSCAQLSLAWLYAKAEELKVTVVPIPGTTKIAHAASNMASVDVVLGKEEVNQLEALGALVVGARGSKEYQANALESQALE